LCLSNRKISELYGRSP
jgi:hypothetical protein